MIITEKYNDIVNAIRSKDCFSNRILYRMCEENPLHNDPDVIIGKILIIGRTYAAAIERRKTEDRDSLATEDYYDGVVAEQMLKVGDELDSRLKQLRTNTGSARENLNDILVLHGELVDTFKKISGLEKRSLASKYLHFHCPDKFFIYDSRAHNAINKIVQRPDKWLINELGDKIDQVYGGFVLRMIELQEHFETLFGRRYSPRELDRFLLLVDQKIKQKKRGNYET